MNIRDEKICSNCYWRCFAVRNDELNNKQFCIKQGNGFLHKVFEDYDENKTTCEKFEKGKHSFYGDRN